LDVNITEDFILPSVYVPYGNNLVALIKVI